MDDVFKVLGLIGFLVLTVFFWPMIAFWFAYLGGWIAKVVIGTQLASALNVLFNTSYFVPAMLPKMAGALGWIGGFFKTTSLGNKNKDK